jgi:hypothetical protein
MAAPHNKGNLITRRAFTEEGGLHANRIRDLHEVTGRALSTCYQYTEEIGLYGSGTPSPLYVVIESVRRLHARDTEEGCAISYAQEFAQAPLIFLSQLRGETPSDIDAVGKLNFLLKNASDANYMLRGRDLKELPPSDLKDFAQKLMTVVSIAHELGMMVDGQIRLKEGDYPGAPIQGERTLQTSQG